MNKFFNDLQKEARNIKLSTSEKQSMRVHLYNMMDAAPAVLSATQKVAIDEFKNRKATPSMFNWFSPRYMVPVAVVLLVGLSGGSAFAAQSALPGEPLYAVKINVNEKVATALATTPQAKAAVNATIATTRLEEAETLASTGKLDATTTAALASNFAAHAEAAQQNTVALQTNDPGTAAQLGATFSSTLAAHVAILSQLATDAGVSPVQQNSDALAVQVQASEAQGRHDDVVQNDGSAVVTTMAIAPNGEGVAVSTMSADEGAPTAGDTSGDTTQDQNAVPASEPAVNVRVAATIAPQAANFTVESTTTTQADAPVAPMAKNKTIVNATYSAKKSASAVERVSTNDNVIALALGSQASTSLSNAGASFEALAPSLDASTTEQITLKLTDLGEMLMQGNDALIAGDTAAANTTFSRVLRTSVKLDAFFKAGKKFNASFLTSLLK